MSNYEKWKLSIQVYKRLNEEKKCDKILDSMFTGSKMTSNYICSTVISDSEERYNKQYSIYKDKLTDFVDRILELQNC